jgi:hypothetical protein
MSSIIKVDTIQDQDGNNIINENANTITIGKSGDTVTVASGATFVGGSISWQSVQTTGFTAVAGNGYFCNTTSAGFTVTLPATPSAGDQIQLVDYAGTFDTNALVISPNGGKIEGGTDNLQLDGEREGATLTYIDSTQGWLATSGINEGTDALSPVPYSIDFLVIAGGAGGGGTSGSQITGGGGGAGGYRTSTQTVNLGTVITVTVGDGGAGRTSFVAGGSGSNSSISGSGLTTITSNGGGGGGTYPGGALPVDGGSGGGGGHNYSPAVRGLGNTPSTSPSQGNNGGFGSATGPFGGSGGGGGANASGSDGSGEVGGAGGAGTASSITGSSVTRAGGGGGGGNTTSGNGGSGGGGNGGTESLAGVDGTANTGGGGGGGTYISVSRTSGSGGKGVVILAFPLASFSNTTTGSPTESDDGTTKVLIFNGDGSYTA